MSSRGGQSPARGEAGPESAEVCPHFPRLYVFPFTFSAKPFAWRCGLIFVVFSFFWVCFVFRLSRIRPVGRMRRTVPPKPYTRWYMGARMSDGRFPGGEKRPPLGSGARAWVW